MVTFHSSAATPRVSHCAPSTGLFRSSSRPADETPGMRSSLRLAAATFASLVLVTACGSASSPGASTAGEASSSAAEAASSPAESAALPDGIPEQLQQALDDVQAQYDFPGALAGVWRPDGEWTGLVGRGRAIAKPAHRPGGPRSDRQRHQDVHRHRAAATRGAGPCVAGRHHRGVRARAAERRHRDPARPGPHDQRDPPLHAVEESTDAYFADPTRVWQPAELIDFVKGTEPQFAPGEGACSIRTPTQCCWAWSSSRSPAVR